MEGSIRLSAGERKVLLKVYRYGKDLQRARRAHVLLLLAAGHSYRAISDLLFASFDLISAAVQSFRNGGVDAIAGEATVRDEVAPLCLLQVSHYLMSNQPEDFGYQHRRWTCEMLRAALFWSTGQQVSREQVRRGLKRLQFVWRRPRPVLGRKDPDYGHKLRQIQDLLADLSPHETAVFQDDVDVHLNPKIGSCWMVRGEQAQVVTPGNNEKRHLAGSLNWRTETLLVSPPAMRRNAELFVRHLDDLRRRRRSYRKIHVICDNSAFHQCRLVKDYISRWLHRIQLHYLPKYAPETNPLQRVWWQLHKTVTRNHRCTTMQQLLGDVDRWVQRHGNFAIETNLYHATA